MKRKAFVHPGSTCKVERWLVGSASLGSSTPRAKGKEDGGEARTMHAEYAGQRVPSGRLRKEGTGDTWT